MSGLVKLICLALIITPFFTLPGMGIREAKMVCAGFFSLSIISLALWEGIHIKLKNKWLLILMPYLILATYLAPMIPIQFLGIKLFSPWLFKPLLYIVISFILYVVISSYKFNSKDISGIFGTLSWVGLAMAIYVIAQSLGIDKFFQPREIPAGISGLVQPNLVGSLGNPTLVSPFIAMCLPFTLYRKSFVEAIIMSLAICLTLSAIAIGAMIISVSFFFLSKKVNLSTSLLTSISILIIITAGTQLLGHGKSILSSSGRIGRWVQIVEEMRKPFFINDKPYGLTGYGFGSMPFTYAIPRGSDFFQAHNEFIDILYQTGLIGILLFLLSIYDKIKRLVSEALKTPELITILSSFLCISLAACGTFVWQIGAIWFYTIIILGLTNSVIRK